MKNKGNRVGIIKIEMVIHGKNEHKSLVNASCIIVEGFANLILSEPECVHPGVHAYLHSTYKHANTHARTHARIRNVKLRG